MEHVLRRMKKIIFCEPKRTFRHQHAYLDKRCERDRKKHLFSVMPGDRGIARRHSCGSCITRLPIAGERCSADGTGQTSPDPFFTLFYDPNHSRRGLIAPLAMLNRTGAEPEARHQGTERRERYRLFPAHI